MTRYLYSVEPVPDRPDIAWVSLPVSVENFQAAMAPHGVAVFGGVCLALDGEEVPRHHNGVTVLSSVGSYDDTAGLITLLTPRLVAMAISRLEDLVPPRWRAATDGALARRPWENALWVLRCTPEQLQSWAAALRCLYNPAR